MTTPDSHAAAAAEHAAKIPPHVAGSLVALHDAVDIHWPNRDHSSDGIVGDARHQAENGPEGPGSGSDHNAWLNNTYRAEDFTATHRRDDGTIVHGIDGPWFAEQLRVLGHYGDPRLVGGGYVIWDGQITSPDFTHWQHYTGSDPHTSHVHVSVTRHAPQYEYGGLWSFLAAKPTPRQPTLPTPAPAPHVDPPPPTGHDATGRGGDFRADFGDEGPEVRELQHDLNAFAPAYADLVEDGVYGQHTADAVEEFGHRSALEHHTPDADRPSLAGADGRNVGPRLAAALNRDGLI